MDAHDEAERLFRKLGEWVAEDTAHYPVGESGSTALPTARFHAMTAALLKMAAIHALKVGRPDLQGAAVIEAVHRLKRAAIEAMVGEIRNL